MFKGEQNQLGHVLRMTTDSQRYFYTIDLEDNRSIYRTARSQTGRCIFLKVQVNQWPVLEEEDDKEDEVQDTEDEENEGDDEEDEDDAEKANYIKASVAVRNYARGDVSEQDY